MSCRQIKITRHVPDMGLERAGERAHIGCSKSLLEAERIALRQEALEHVVGEPGPIFLGWRNQVGNARWGGKQLAGART